MPRPIRTREIKTLFDRSLRAGSRKQQYVACAIAVRTHGKAMHTAFQIEQIGAWMLLQIRADWHELRSIEDSERQRLLSVPAWLAGKDEVDRSL